MGGAEPGGPGGLKILIISDSSASQSPISKTNMHLTHYYSLEGSLLENKSY